MDLLESQRRRRVTLPAALGVTLLVLAAGQAAALLRTPALPEDVALTVPKEAFGFDVDAGDLTVSFQLRNDSPRSLRVADVGEQLPGLELVDVVASGSPVKFRELGTGAAALPAFELPPRSVALLSLTYRVTACDEVPADLRPVPVAVVDGRARGIARVPLPQLPDDAEGATEADVVEWQQVLVRDLCA